MRTKYLHIFYSNETITAVTHMAFDSDSISMKRRKLQYGWGVLIGKRI